MAEITSDDPENNAKKKSIVRITPSEGADLKEKKTKADIEAITVLTNIVHFLEWTQLEKTDMNGEPTVQPREVIEMNFAAFFDPYLSP